MSMPAFKWTMVFNYLSGEGDGTWLNLKGGWTESVYWNTMTATTLNQFKTLCVARAAMLPLRCYISGIRVQQVDPSGSAQTFPVNYPGGGGGAAYVADIPQMALLLRVRGAGVANVRSMRLAGIPDGQVTAGEYRPTVGFTVVTAAFLAQLSGWLFRGTDLTVTPANIATIDALGTYVLQQDLILSVGQRVKVHGTMDANKDTFGGTFKVGTYTDSKHGVLNNWTFGATVLGTMKPYTIIYPTIIADSTSISRVVPRKIGRPSLGYRGRRSKRRV
jgi:hypothetical protein